MFFSMCFHKNVSTINQKNYKKNLLWNQKSKSSFHFHKKALQKFVQKIKGKKEQQLGQKTVTKKDLALNPSTTLSQLLQHRDTKKI